MTDSDSDMRRSRRLLRRVHKHRLETIKLLPSMITLVNGICGFAAIGLAAKGRYDAACYLIFVGMIADMLDGRVARMSQSTSSFGGQLDSLCDVLTFGAAPAFIVLSLLMANFEALVGSAKPFIGEYFERFIWIAGVGYLCCGLIRLARFNVENEEGESTHMTFTGLPSPAAAGVLAGLVMFYHDLLADSPANSAFFSFLLAAILYMLPFVTLGCGLLMVSRIRYPHVLNQLFRGRKPVTYLLWVGLVGGMIFICGLQLSLVISFGIFALSGFLPWFYRKVIYQKLLHRTHRPVEPVAHDPSV
ncbi:MAG: CDP-diacylglycerol--serine O-phosphatidyltransferase [Planctomycetota bacterium]|jgi:CDP-diacylglycerol--serine O-phosphatidyltransferase